MFEGTMLPFIELFPEQGQNECKVAHVSKHNELPPGQYAFLELYCTDLQCNCRRVMINVIREPSHKHIATINYGFDRGDKIPGPFLDPINTQSKYSRTLLDMFKWILQDQFYRARLEKHYLQFKAALKQGRSQGKQVIRKR